MLLEVPQKVPRETHSGLLSSKCDASGAPFAFRTLPCDSASLLSDAMLPLLLHCSQREKNKFPARTDCHALSQLSSALNLHLLGIMCLQHSFLTAFPEIWSSRGFGEGSPLPRECQRWVVVASLQRNRKGIAVLWVQGMSAIASLLSQKHPCNVRQDSKRAWTFETRARVWLLTFGRSCYDGETLRERPCQPCKPQDRSGQHYFGGFASLSKEGSY